MPAFNPAIILIGCLGGLLPDALRIARNRYRADALAYLKRPQFWLGVLMLALVGGLTVWVFNLSAAKDALIYGYAAPAVISQLVASVVPEDQEPPRAQGAPRKTAPSEAQGGFNLLKWWRA
ncbi:MAG: hypothetical protein JW929_11975 [Anaerolineales bacterium]|nr:hypothetical protein [Anaerolineales bacterium]